MRQRASPACAILALAMVRKARGAQRATATPAIRESEIDRALDAMTPPELRAARRVVLRGLREDVKTTVVETLLARATKGTAGWKPTSPSPRIVEQAAVVHRCGAPARLRGPVRRHRTPPTCHEGLSRGRPRHRPGRFRDDSSPDRRCRNRSRSGRMCYGCPGRRRAGVRGPIRG